ncbi:hypothetical protein GDO78_023302 [Eleutherodactylus coqui]|uniref:Uncharacterized protein n=1 Tax=Eleutherodactylus coqui TaxID=57060 RepID=A0A8J6E4X7_ELECQ|nr:hypothetical protein GDO78_023302 [Eleutherodactylus coqui]
MTSPHAVMNVKCVIKLLNCTYPPQISDPCYTLSLLFPPVSRDHIPAVASDPRVILASRYLVMGPRQTTGDCLRDAVRRGEP